MNWEVIPEVFWDFIARVLPGALILFAAYLVFPDLYSSAQLTIELMIAYLVPSYFFAVALHQVWLFLYKKDREREIDRKFQIQTLMSRLELTRVGMMLLKVQAEIISCTVVIVGLLPLSVANIVFVLKEQDCTSLRRLIFLVVFLVLIFGCFSWKKALQEYQDKVLQKYKTPNKAAQQGRA